MLSTLAAQPLLSQAPAQAATRTGRYIVSTYSADGTDAALARLSRTGTRASRRYHRVLDGFAARLTASQVATLRDDPGVRRVTPDRILRISSSQSSPSWGLDRIDQRAEPLDRSYSYATTGAGVSVYSIDTGIRLDHHEFGGRAVSGYDYVDGDSDASDCNGHGTHVAGTVGGSTYGVAKAANLVALRVLDCDGDGYESDFISALQYVIDHHAARPAVVNISAGGEVSTELDQAVAAVVQAGVPVVVAAGNDDRDACTGSPAREPSAITVAASTKTDDRAGFSDFGSCVDVFAPGTEVLSAYTGSSTATATLEGTSMATPHVVGAVARYLQAYPTASPAAVSKALVGDATSSVVTGLAGSPDRLLYLRSTTTGAATSVAASHSDTARTITMKWSSPYGFGAQAVTGYRLTRTGRAMSVPVSVQVDDSQRAYTFGNLVLGATYTVTVQPINAAGLGSPWSTKVRLLATPGSGRVRPPRAR